MVYQKREELEAELHNIHKRKLSSEPHVKKRYKLGNQATITSTTLPSVLFCCLSDVK
jgi:hypothetical protein